MQGGRALDEAVHRGDVRRQYFVAFTSRFEVANAAAEYASFFLELVSVFLLDLVEGRQYTAAEGALELTELDDRHERIGWPLGVARSYWDLGLGGLYGGLRRRLRLISLLELAAGGDKRNSHRQPEGANKILHFVSLVRFGG